MKKYVLGIKIDDVNMEEAVKTVESWLSKGGKPFDKTQGKPYIVTPNPEIIVVAQSDSRFKKILKMADLSIPDGVGLKLAGIKNRITGVDLMLELIKLSSKKEYSVGLLGGREGVAQRTADELVRRYPKLKISFAESGPVIPAKAGIYTNNYLWIPDPFDFAQGGQVRDDKKVIDLLFVAFGHGKQEKWIAANLDKLPVKVAMGVGGAFDYISGKVPRAPSLVRKLGFEWLYRLILQPWRMKRQLALVKFVWLLILRKSEVRS